MNLSKIYFHDLLHYKAIVQSYGAIKVKNLLIEDARTFL